MILALDNATKSIGYAVFTQSKVVNSGVFTLRDKILDERLKSLESALAGLICDYHITEVVFEDTVFSTRIGGNISTLKTLCWLQGIIMRMCHEKNTPYTMLYPSAWRKVLGFPSGKRKEQKLHAIAYVKEQFGIECKDDEAEAICIGFARIKIKETEGL